VAPTGTGKSFLSTRGLLPVLGEGERALIIDDDAETTIPGFSIRVRQFPSRPWRQYYRARYGERYRPVFRLTVPEDLTLKSIHQQRARVYRALRAAFKERDWTIFIPELTMLTDSIADYGLGLKGVMNILLRRGRRRRVSVVSETQAPRWISRYALDQPIGVYVSQIGDWDARVRLREIGGNSKMLMDALGSLDGHEFVFCGQQGRILQRVQVGRE
jgi:DNA helicase HerA-like ATPase